MVLLNPLNPESDQHLISPNSNTAESFIEIMSYNRNYCQLKKLWLLKKFSLLVLKEMYREEYGECGY